MILPLLLLVACGEPPPPLRSEQAPTPPAAEATVPAAPVAPPSHLWTPADVDQLAPLPPTREDRTPRPIPASAEIDRALATLGAVVDSRARDADNPWAVAHALLARGKDLTLSDGRPAVDELFADYAEASTAGTHTLLRFPDKRGEIRVEPHMGLQLKVMTEVGVDPTHPVKAAGGEHTVADLYRGYLISGFLDLKSNKASFRSPDDIGWLVQGLAAWAPTPGDLRWTASEGGEQTLNLLTRFSVAALVKETQFLSDAMAADQGFERKGQGIFRYTCGGAHLLQGAAYAVARGFGGEAEKQAIRDQAVLHLWRFPREQAITDAAIKAAPEHRLKLLSQRLKFAGHALESIEKLEILGFITPDADQQATIQSMATSIVQTTTTLDQGGGFKELDEIKSKDFQLYLDLVGDSAHAIRGLNLALGRDTLRW